VEVTLAFICVEVDVFKSFGLCEYCGRLRGRRSTGSLGVNDGSRGLAEGAVDFLIKGLRGLADLAAATCVVRRISRPPFCWSVLTSCKIGDVHFREYTRAPDGEIGGLVRLQCVLGRGRTAAAADA